MADSSAPAVGFSSALIRYLVGLLTLVYLGLIVGVPTLATVLLAQWLLRQPDPYWVALAALPVVFGLTYVFVCGVLSCLTRVAIVEGKFPRDLGHIVYGPRRLYALCWTSLYYFPALYHAVLALPWLKWLVLRLFGYQGSVRMTLYPDTWIRDLPLLHIGPGAYISNKATLGTNMCLADGSILVQRVRIERDALIGHLVMVAPGVVVGASSEIGSCTTLGPAVHIGHTTRIGPCCGIHIAAHIGNHVVVGARSYIGVKAHIADGLRLPNDTSIPDRAVLSTQADVARYVRQPLVAA